MTSRELHAFPPFPFSAHLLVLTLAVTAFTPLAKAQTAEVVASEPRVVSPADSSDGDRFGSSLALDGKHLAVGATGIDQPTDRAGAVYLFERNMSDWKTVTTLYLEGVGVDAGFGIDVHLDGDWLAAGAPGVYAGDGAIYLFQREDSDWQQQHRFLLPESQEFTFFGSSLAMENGLLAVGAPGYDAGASDSGIVMIYRQGENGEWSPAGTLQPDRPMEGERFGSDLALDDGQLIVGADGVGAAYLFAYRNGQWAQIGRVSEELGERSGFGASVALSGSLALVGAPFAESAAGTRPGAAVLYAKGDDGWARLATLRPDNPGRSDQFGAAVALTEQLALVASPRDDRDADNAGAVFVFTPDDDGWALRGQWSGPEPAAYDEFGRSLAVDSGGRTAVVGTPDDAVPGGEVEGHPGTVTAFTW